MDLLLYSHIFFIEKILHSPILPEIYLPLALGLNEEVNFFFSAEHLLLMNISCSTFSFYSYILEYL